MSTCLEEHPRDEVLSAFALGEPDEATKKHLASCPSCSRQVREFQELTEALTGLPEEEVPARLREKLFKAIRGKQWGTREWFSLSCVRLLRTPFILVLAMIAFVLFLYIVIVFIL